MSGIREKTVPWVPLDDFDWSFARKGPLPWNLTLWCLLAVFTALPLWTTIELTIWVLGHFKRYRGVYFCSVLLTTWGVTLHAIGFLLKFGVPSVNWIVSTVLAEVGWVAMVTGFSITLWSRLHLVSISVRALRLVLAMIVVDGFLFHVPTIVFQVLASNPPTHAQFLPYLEIMERVQVIAFSVQETIVSAIYVYCAMRFLRQSLTPKVKRTLAWLIFVQVLVVFANGLLIALDFLQYWNLKALMHSFIYAIKLQLELVILNELRSRILHNGLGGQVITSRWGPHRGGNGDRGGNRDPDDDDCTPSSTMSSPKPMTTTTGNKTKWWSRTNTALSHRSMKHSSTPIHTNSATIYATNITIHSPTSMEPASFSFPLPPQRGSQTQLQIHNGPHQLPQLAQQENSAQTHTAVRKSSAPQLPPAPRQASWSSFADTALPFIIHEPSNSSTHQTTYGSPYIVEPTSSSAATTLITNPTTQTRHFGEQPRHSSSMNNSSLPGNAIFGRASVVDVSGPALARSVSVSPVQEDLSFFNGAAVGGQQHEETDEMERRYLGPIGRAR